MSQIGQNSYPMTKTSVKPSDTGPLFARSPLEDGTSDPLFIRKALQVMDKQLELPKLSRITFEEDDEEVEGLNMRSQIIREAWTPVSDSKMILFSGFTLPKAKYFDPYCRENSDAVRRLKATLNSRTVAQSTSSTAYPIGIQPSSCGGGQLHSPQANQNKEHVILIPSGLAGTHPETGVSSTVVDNSSTSGANPDDNRSPSEANPDDDRSPSEANPDDDSLLSEANPDDNRSLSEANPDDNRSPSEANPDDNRSPSEAYHEFDLEKKIMPVVTLISCLGAVNKSNSEMSRNDKILVYCFLGCLLILLASGSYGFLLARFKGPRINVIARFLMRVACAAAGASLIVVMGMWLPNDENKLLITGLVCCVFLPALALGMMK